jgi:hypothetical protein
MLLACSEYFATISIMPQLWVEDFRTTAFALKNNSLQQTLGCYIIIHKEFCVQPGDILLL